MKLVLADDAVLLREGLAGLLTRLKCEVIAQADTAPALLQTLRALAADGNLPDVVITDVRMPPGMGEDGLEAAIEIRRLYPKVGIMVLSQYVAPAYASTLFRQAPTSKSAGGLGYLLKDRVSRVADFMRSLTIVASGGVVVDPEVATRLISSDNSALKDLTPRELEVLSLMAQGLSNTQIEEKLFLSRATVAKHVANIFLKLGLGPDEDNRRVRAVLTYLTETGGNS